MAKNSMKSVFTSMNGFWKWDDNACGLVFKSYASAETPKKLGASGHKTSAPVAAAGPFRKLRVTFRGQVDLADQLYFRRNLRRSAGPDVVTLGDVKDVVLFTATPRLPAPFVRLFHRPAADRFLRALVAYLRFFTQTWLDQRGRRTAEASMVPQSRSSEKGRKLRNLADLRALAGREMALLLLELGEEATRRHLTCREQASRDLLLVELLLATALRVVWVALERRFLPLLRVEVDRLFRSPRFCSAARRLRVPAVLYDDAVPKGGPGAGAQLSPATEELLRGGEGDYQVLLVGIADLPHRDSRLAALERLLSAPEEQLAGQGVGILGRPRADYDCLLNPVSSGRQGSASDAFPDEVVSDDQLRRWSTISQLGAGRSTFTELMDLPQPDPDRPPASLEAFPYRWRRPTPSKRSVSEKNWLNFARGHDYKDKR